ncbi:uncharacterized protein LOC144178423 [Haemaphysalis longicornis]
MSQNDIGYCDHLWISYGLSWFAGSLFCDSAPVLAAGGCTTCCSPVPTFLRDRRNEIVVLQETHNNLKLQQVHDALLASPPFLARKPIGTKLWFCRKRTTISSCSKTCHPMARRDGFRALSLSRKDGGVARGVPSAASGDRKNLKTKV